MTATTIVSAQDPSGTRVVSVVTAMCYRVSRSGRCAAGEAPALVTAPAYYEGPDERVPLRARALRRDLDGYGWKKYTDLVVQGTVRTDTPRRMLLVDLDCPGLRKRVELRVCGDRWVERGPAGLTFSEPQPFTEIPVRYDRAYGGSDALAAQRLQLAPSASNTIYPRNPAGKGYVIEADGAVGTSLPNLEFTGDELTPARLVAPASEWARRPFPAALDWFSHTWFPRSALFGLTPPPGDGAPPQPEAALGLLPPETAKIPLLMRLRHELAQGAHPFLWNSRLRGDEPIGVSSMSTDGRDFRVQLPAHRPRIFIRQLTDPEELAPVVLDAVFIETEHDRVTLIWRGSLPACRPGMPRGWERLCAYRVVW